MTARVTAALAASMLAVGCKAERDAPLPATACHAATYAVARRSPGGGEVRGTIALQPQGATCRAHWELDDGTRRDGVGFVAGHALVIGWGSSGSFGAMMYAIDGGQLHGTEAEHGHDDLTPEELRGSAGLDGAYAIVRATTHNGTPYTGTVTIHPNGAVYDLVWETECACKTGPTHGRDVGVGILRDGHLFAAWSEGSGDVAVFDYAEAGSGWDGVWAARGGSATGGETAR